MFLTSTQIAKRLEAIFEQLRQRVPRLEWVDAQPMPDGRLLLRIKDAPFAQPVLSRYASDGTLKMLAYLIFLNDPQPPRFIGIKEPENFLHPRLLPGLAEECRAASERTQLFVTTHSPDFLNGMQAEDVRALYRTTRIRCLPGRWLLLGRRRSIPKRLRNASQLKGRACSVG